MFFCNRFFLSGNKDFKLILIKLLIDVNTKFTVMGFFKVFNDRTTISKKKASGAAQKYKNTTRMRARVTVKRGAPTTSLVLAKKAAKQTQNKLQDFLGSKGTVTVGTSKVVKMNKKRNRAEVDLHISVKGKNHKLVEAVYREAQRHVGYMVSQPVHFK